jgi:DNA-binding transcriptional LysR family regulator
MLEGIEALVALERFETMSEAAVRLRLTQSAVSKRLRALEKELGFKLLERDGRRTRLLPRALELLERARPLVAELRALSVPERHVSAPAVFSLALADSIASSWGPRVLREAIGAVVLDLHAHRSVLVVESVRLGRYQLGLCTDSPPAKDLIHHPIVEEPMVIAHAAGAERADPRQPLISIEPTSATWRAIEPQLRARHPRLLERRLIAVESFGAALQMVKAGFGDGLVPLGLAMEAGVHGRARVVLPRVRRNVSLLMRKLVHHMPEVAAFRDRLSAAAARYFEEASSDR